MNKPQSFSGVLSPVLTPFNEDLSPDTERFVAHCRWLLEQGATGLAVFGTTSEANSLSVEERLELLDALIAGGIAPAQLMPGTGCCALTDTVRLTCHAVSKGCAGVLLLPPFYYKGVSDDGLYANVAEVIERVGDDHLRIYLYHFPAMAVIGYSLDLIERLIKGYPSVVVAGSEVFLLQGLRAGAAGCITATANVNVSMVRNLYDRWQTPAADALQDEITALRNTIHAYPMIPALKQIIAHYRNDAAWRAVRPPLVHLSAAQARSLIADLEQKKFALAA
jgi:4-hydroxy-tetrahydrodipicolinate synthase